MDSHNPGAKLPGLALAQMIVQQLTWVISVGRYGTHYKMYACVGFHPVCIRRTYSCRRL